MMSPVAAAESGIRILPIWGFKEFRTVWWDELQFKFIDKT